jgi:putative acetyltransferase
MDEARKRGYRRMSLETGAAAFFKAAHTLYASHGFERCPPFDKYIHDPNSVFMTQEL